MFYDPSLKPKTNLEWAEENHRQRLLKNGAREGLAVNMYAPGISLSGAVNNVLKEGATVRCAVQEHGLGVMNDPAYCNSQEKMNIEYNADEGMWHCIGPGVPHDVAVGVTRDKALSALDDWVKQSQGKQPMSDAVGVMFDAEDKALLKDVPEGESKLSYDKVSKNGYGKKLSQPTADNVRLGKGYSEAARYLDELKEAWTDEKDAAWKTKRAADDKKAINQARAIGAATGLIKSHMEGKFNKKGWAGAADKTSAAFDTAASAYLFGGLIKLGRGIEEPIDYWLAKKYDLAKDKAAELWAKIRGKLGKKASIEEVTKAADQEISHGQVGKGIEYKESFSDYDASMYLRSLRESDEANESEELAVVGKPSGKTSKGPTDEVIDGPNTAMASAEEEDKGTTPDQPVDVPAASGGGKSGGKSSKKSESAPASISYKPYQPSMPGEQVIGSLCESDPYAEFNAMLKANAAEKLSESKKKKKAIPPQFVKEEKAEDESPAEHASETKLDEEAEEAHKKGDKKLEESPSPSSMTPDNTIAHQTLGVAPMPSDEKYSEGWSNAHEIPRNDKDKMIAMWSQQERANRLVPR